MRRIFGSSSSLILWCWWQSTPGGSASHSRWRRGWAARASWLMCWWRSSTRRCRRLGRYRRWRIHCYIYSNGYYASAPNRWGHQLLSDDAVWRLSVAYTGPKPRTEMPRKTKIGTDVAHVTRDSDTTFKVKRSKVKVTRPLCSTRR